MFSVARKLDKEHVLVPLDWKPINTKLKLYTNTSIELHYEF